MEKEKNNGKVWWIFGLIFLIISIGIFCVFTNMFIGKFATGDDKVSGAISLVFGVVFFYIPTIIATLLSLLCNTVAFCKRKSINRIITFVLSLLVLVGLGVETVLLYI